MCTVIRRWRQSRLHRATLRELRSLPPAELRALGIAPAEIERLAQEATRQAAHPGFHPKNPQDLSPPLDLKESMEKGVVLRPRTRAHPDPECPTNDQPQQRPRRHARLKTARPQASGAGLRHSSA